MQRHFLTWGLSAWFVAGALTAQLLAQTPAVVDPPTKPAAPAVTFAPGLVHWKAYAGNPVFTGAGGEAWDANIRERGWILRDGNQWRMWYTGYKDKTSLRMLGLATSDDGIQWQRSPENPLNREHWIEDMMIVRHGELYHMFAEGKNDNAHYLTSPDGVQWTRVGPLDIRLTNGEPISAGPRGTPTVWIEGDVWYLFYERGDRGVWLATSRDRKTWINVQDDPVLACGTEGYDRYAVAMNQIVQLDGQYYGFYHASDTPEWKEWSTCVAVSKDLKTWHKYPQNPLLRENKSSGIVVPDGKQFRLYTMHKSVQLHLPE